MTFLRSAAILAAMTLVPAYAAAQGTAEERAACTGDAMSLCGEFIPSVEKITACMKSKIKELSPGCRAHFGTKSARAKSRPTPVADRVADKHQPLH